MLTCKYVSGMAALCLTSLLTCANVYAAQPGLYLGAQLGWGNVNQTGISSADMGNMIGDALGNGNFTMTSFNGTTSGNGFGWRVFGGYQIGYNWAAEIGWAIYPNLPIPATASGIDHNSGLPFRVSTSGTYKTAAFDLVGKYIVPLRCNFNAYGKLGAAFVVGRSNEGAEISETGFSQSANENNKTNRIFPTFGIGVDYDFRPDISADLSYNRLQKIGDSNQLGSIDYVSLGLALHFV